MNGREKNRSRFTGDLNSVLSIFAAAHGRKGKEHTCKNKNACCMQPFDVHGMPPFLLGFCKGPLLITGQVLYNFIRGWSNRVIHLFIIGIF